MSAYRQQENLGQHALDLVGGQVSPVDAPVGQPRRQPVVAQPIARLGGRPRRDQLMAEMRIGMRRGVPIAELIIDRRRGRILDPIERPPLRLDQRGDLPFVAMPDDAIAFVASRLRSEEHTSELQSLMRISYAVFCLQKKTNDDNTTNK